ncbi:aminoacyl tRNA synthase complex-interacting multifunctional protein 1 isoform X3 [Gouania willdenowi]|uniref:aminoacyl tRNA synthase complex-interacting multifunctional protein 1 isoform X3 n=1 Tax=Gouania willdenowi TaxID=441366 RepID=UPI0010555E92|nr:aminoacyl tRNA synthase complex-interacting multifunctional protein 1-like isoform X3 [Gouania willdenowi]
MREEAEPMQTPLCPLAAALRKLDPEDGEQVMEYLKTHALLSREKALLQASVREQKKLLVENAKLKTDIEHLKTQLHDKQKRRSGKAMSHSCISSASTVPDKPAPPPVDEAPPTTSSPDRSNPRRRRKAPPTSDCLPLGVEPQDEVHRLDLRVGRLLSEQPHPQVESLWVQEVDVGESRPRTVVSNRGLQQLPGSLPGSLAVLLCNVKPCKIRGVVSKARLLCCSSPDSEITELLAPPTGSLPGDRVTFLNFPGDPDRELRSKLRLFERLQAEMAVDGRGVATFRGCGFEVKGKGLCRAPTLTNATIR